VSIVKLEVAPRCLFGKPVQKVKVNCKNSSEKPKLTSVLRSLEEAKKHLEDDVRLSIPHLINKWFRAKFFSVTVPQNG
jgi:hypothetical protein